MKLTSVLDEKTIKTIKIGDKLTLLLKGNGRKISRSIEVKVAREIKERRCKGCGMFLEGKPTKEIDGEEYCLDCYNRRTPKE